MRSRSLFLWLYLLFSRHATGLAERMLARRLMRGKEDAARIHERRGVASLPRPEGVLVWFHAASVGEALSLLELIRRLREEREDLSILVTTGTVTSASVMGRRLPVDVIHHYVPLDVTAYVTRFLDHWKPDLAIWTESELWPSLITATHTQGCPMLLLNARLSVSSARNWRWFKGMARALLSRFDLVQAQDDVTASRLRGLGLLPSRIEVTGTLKEGAAALPCDEALRQSLSQTIGARPIWVAASTHAGEEDLVLAAHRIVLRSNPRALLLLVPRHPERGADIERLLQSDGWHYAQRSTGAMPDRDTQVYLADTLGELGLWYRLAPISFLGGSLVEIGGHNPFEPAALGSAILHGPYVSNFTDIFERLQAAGAARQVRDAASLAQGVDELMNPEYAAEMANAAWEVSSTGAEVTDRALDAILERLEIGEAAGQHHAST